MLILCRFSVIGILLLTHIAHTLVLLTANMEDVKKLARKFVSESLADKIAEFIAKATQKIASNVSEESETNAGDEERSHQVSEENNKYDVESAAQEARSREAMEKEKEEISQSVFNEQKDIPESDTPDTDIVEKLEKPNIREKSRYIKADTNTAKQYSYPLKSEKTISKISEEDEKFNKEKEASKYLDENLVNTEEAKSKVPKKKIKARPYTLLSHINSIEDNEVTNAIPDINSTVDDFSENELFNQKRYMNDGIDLTTRKAAFEFDQYDTKAPKIRIGSY